MVCICPYIYFIPPNFYMVDKHSLQGRSKDMPRTFCKEEIPERSIYIVETIV